MSITVDETWTSRSRSKGRAGTRIDRDYVIMGTDNDADAHAALQVAVPGILDLIPLDTVEITDRMTELIWAGRATWSLTPNSQSSEPGDETLSFDTTGESTHIERSLATRSYGEQPADHHGLIGVNGDRVDGTDITIPTLRLQKTLIQTPAFVTPAYINLLADMTGSVNNASWLGREAGEVLFLGASGSQATPVSNWSVTYSFAVSPNATLSIEMLSTTGGTPGVAPFSVLKKGWEYIWLKSCKQLDPVSKRTVEIIHSAYVEQVYKHASFSTLGIGS